MKTIYKLLAITIILAIGLLASFCFGYSEDKVKINKVKKPATITITIDYKEAKPTDTLSLILDNVIFRSDAYNLGKYSKTGINKRFRFVVPVEDHCGYWTITNPNAATILDNGGNSNKVTITDSFFWEAGDNIFVRLSHKENYAGVYSTYLFSGKGAEKYIAQDRINASQVNRLDKPIFDSLFNYSDPSRNAINAKLKVLEGFKDKISTLSYGVLKTDIIAQNLCNEISAPIKTYYDGYIKASVDSTKQRFIMAYMRQLAGKDFQGISAEALSESKRYFKYFHDRLRLESYFKFGRINMDWIFSALRKENNAKVRDRSILYLFNQNRRSENVELLYSKAKAVIKDKYCLMALNKLMEVAAGSKFDTFALEDTSGKPIDLSAFKGKVVFIDLWGDGCGACVNFYKTALSKVEQEFEANKDVVFISVSIDRKKQKWLDGISSGQYTSKNALNLYTNGMGPDHPMLRKYRVRGTPHTILVDRQGKIKYNDTENLYERKGLSTAIKELL